MSGEELNDLSEEEKEEYRKKGVLIDDMCKIERKIKELGLGNSLAKELKGLLDTFDKLENKEDEW